MGRSFLVVSVVSPVNCTGEINIMKAILFMSFMFVMIVSFQSSEAHEEEELEPECFACRCPRNIDYQCGSDGRDYQNKCLFECAKEKCASKTRNTVIARAGRCYA